MVIMYPTDNGIFDHLRVAVLVDIQNMFYSTYKAHHGRLKYGKLLSHVVGERNLVRANAYAVAGNQNQGSFLRCLTEYGYTVKLAENEDVVPESMAFDAMALVDKVDVVILVTGEGDFTNLVKPLVDTSKVAVEVFGFERYANVALKGMADFYEIPEFLVFRKEEEGTPVPPTTLYEDEGDEDDDVCFEESEEESEEIELDDDLVLDRIWKEEQERGKLEEEELNLEEEESGE